LFAVAQLRQATWFTVRSYAVRLVFCIIVYENSCGDLVRRQADLPSGRAECWPSPP